MAMTGITARAEPADFGGDRANNCKLVSDVRPFVLRQYEEPTWQPAEADSHARFPQW